MTKSSKRIMGKKEALNWKCCEIMSGVKSQFSEMTFAGLLFLTLVDIFRQKMRSVGFCRMERLRLQKYYRNGKNIQLLYVLLVQIDKKLRRYMQN